MSNPYKKQNFIDGSILEAKHLNVIEDEVYNMSLEPEVFVQNKQPVNARQGDIWINPDEKYENLIVQLPKYDVEKDQGKVLTINNYGNIIWSIPKETKELPNGEEIYW